MKQLVIDVVTWTLIISAVIVFSLLWVCHAGAKEIDSRWAYTISRLFDRLHLIQRAEDELDTKHTIRLYVDFVEVPFNSKEERARIQEFLNAEKDLLNKQIEERKREVTK